MKKYLAYLSLVLILTTAASCKKDVAEKQDVYSIRVGEIDFNIPADYVVDERNRKDGNHEYVIIAAQIPDLGPLMDGRDYARRPFGENIIGFDLSNNPGGTRLGLDSVIGVVKQNATVSIPELSSLRDGLLNIGYYSTPNGLYHNLYLYIKSGKPVSYLRCGRKPENVNPYCRVTMIYSDKIHLNVTFPINHLDWYATGGIDQILQKVKSWQKGSDPK